MIGCDMINQPATFHSTTGYRLDTKISHISWLTYCIDCSQYNSKNSDDIIFLVLFVELSYILFGIFSKREREIENEREKERGRE